MRNSSVPKRPNEKHAVLIKCSEESHDNTSTSCYAIVLLLAEVWIWVLKSWPGTTTLGISIIGKISGSFTMFSRDYDTCSARFHPTANSSWDIYCFIRRLISQILFRPRALISIRWSPTCPNLIGSFSQQNRDTLRCLLIQPTGHRVIPNSESLWCLDCGAVAIL